MLRVARQMVFDVKHFARDEGADVRPLEKNRVQSTIGLGAMEAPPREKCSNRYICPDQKVHKITATTNNDWLGDRECGKSCRIRGEGWKSNRSCPFGINVVAIGKNQRRNWRGAVF